MVLVVGLVGIEGVGKTTITQHFITSGFMEVSFTDTLKESLCTLLCLDRGRFDDPILKDMSYQDTTKDIYTMTPREMMQKYGDLVKQLFGPNVFIDVVQRRLNHIQTPVVFSDIRCPTEALFVRSLGAQIYRVVPAKLSRIIAGDYACGPVTWDTPHSESLQCSIVCDATICNTGVDLVDFQRVLSAEIRTLQASGTQTNRCIQCGTDMGDCNPRQLCGKTVCGNVSMFLV
jgi:GTPase SAR1 family protein